MDQRLTQSVPNRGLRNGSITVPGCNHDFELGDSPYGTTFSILILSVLLLLALCGNGIILWIILTRRDMKTRTYLFVANLAIANFGMALFCISMRLAFLTVIPTYPSKILCQASIMINSFWLSISVYSVTALALHKYFAIVFPLRRILTQKKVYLLLGMIWFLAFASAIVLLRNKHNIIYKESIYYCSYSEARNIGETLPGIFILIIVFAIPLLTNVLLFGQILSAVKRHTRRMSKCSTISRSEARSHRQVITTIITLFSLYVLSWTPFLVHEILYLMGRSHCSYAQRLLQAAYLIGFSTSAQNSIILCLRNAHLRSEVSALLKPLWSRCLNLKIRGNSQINEKLATITKDRNHSGWCSGHDNAAVELDDLPVSPTQFNLTLSLRVDEL